MPEQLHLLQLSGARHRLRDRPSRSSRGLGRPDLILRLARSVQLGHLRRSFLSFRHCRYPSLFVPAILLLDRGPGDLLERKHPDELHDELQQPYRHFRHHLEQHQAFLVGRLDFLRNRLWQSLRQLCLGWFSRHGCSLHQQHRRTRDDQLYLVAGS